MASVPGSGRPVRTGPGVGWWAALLALIALALLGGAREPVAPLQTGLDPSWGFGLNQLPYTDARFGADVVFTFGPLGYLLKSLDIGSNVIQSLVFWILIHSATAGVIVYHARHSGLLPPLLFVAGLVLARSLHTLLPDMQVLIVSGALVTVRPVHRRWWYAATVGASVLAALSPFLKSSLGLGAASMLAVSLWFWRARGSITTKDIVRFGIAPFVAVLLALTFFVLGGPGNLVRWIGQTIQIAGGYAEAMSSSGELNLGVVMTAFVGLAVLVATVFLLRRLPGPRRVGLSLIVPMLLLFKYTFVRHNGRFIFPVTLGALGVLALVTPARPRRHQGIVAAALVIVMGLGMASFAIECACPWDPNRLLLDESVPALRDMVRLPAARARARRESKGAIIRRRLPGTWVRRMQAPRATVDSIPWELSYLPANGLRWAPYPTMQTYAAYTGALDRLGAEHFSDAERPTYLLAEFIGIDGRDPLGGAPATWRAILRNYELAGRRPQGPRSYELFLLHRRADPPPDRARILRTSQGSLRRWTSVPAVGGGLLFAHIEVRPNLKGRLARLAWRVPPLTFVIEYRDGLRKRNRVLAQTLENGLLVDLPVNPRALQSLLEGDPTRRAARIRLTGPGTPYYQREFTIRWEVTDWRPGGEADRPVIDSGVLSP